MVIDEGWNPVDRATILIVEDEAATILDLHDRLEGLGYEVAGFATCGQGALSQIEENRPDLVIMDVRLKGEMDGIETAEAIRGLYDIPVIFVTAYLDEGTVQRARHTEPLGYLPKPLNSRELYTTIEMALYRHRSEQALKESERRQRLYAKRLEILHQIDQAILAADSLEAITGSALRFIEQLVPCRQAHVLILGCQRNGDAALVVGDRGHTPPPRPLFSLAPESAYYQGLAAGKIQIAAHDGLAHHLAANGLWGTEPMPFYVSVPLLNQGVLLGTLNFGAEEAIALSQEQLDIVREVADSLAVAMHQVQLRERVEQHTAELEARNAELNTFAQTVAHDIKDPLGLVIGFADILVQGRADMAPEEMQEYLRIISRTSHKIDNIIHELILLAETRAQDVEVHPLEMEDIANLAQLRLVHLIEEHGAEISLPDAWPVALGYEPWIEEVWVNYLSNAIKYGGRPPRVELGATVVGDRVRFWARDNGPGVPLETQDRLFVPFTRMNQVRVKGYGLGLSIVRCIVEKLGGQVDVESKGVPGEGSTFGFTLPAALDRMTSKG